MSESFHDVDTLLAGRLLMGVGTGLASSGLTSYMVDAAPGRQVSVRLAVLIRNLLNPQNDPGSSSDLP